MNACLAPYATLLGLIADTQGIDAGSCFTTFKRDSSPKKLKRSHSLLMLMLMDGQVKFFSPQSTAGGSQEKGVGGKSVLNLNMLACFKKHY